MTYEITKSAERDIKGILAETLKFFGTRQLAVYQEIIDKGIAMVGDDPNRAGSLDRSEIAPDVKLFHLELAAGRRGAAAHCLYYTTGRTSSGAIGTIILRVLHEHMEPRYKLVRSLNDFTAQRLKENSAEDGTGNCLPCADGQAAIAMMPALVVLPTARPMPTSLSNALGS